MVLVHVSAVAGGGFSRAGAGGAPSAHPCWKFGKKCRNFGHKHPYSSVLHKIELKTTAINAIVCGFLLKYTNWPRRMFSTKNRIEKLLETRSQAQKLTKKLTLRRAIFEGASTSIFAILPPVHQPGVSYRTKKKRSKSVNSGSSLWAKEYGKPSDFGFHKTSSPAAVRAAPAERRQQSGSSRTATVKATTIEAAKSFFQISVFLARVKNCQG